MSVASIFVEGGKSKIDTNFISPLNAPLDAGGFTITNASIQVTNLEVESVQLPAGSGQSAIAVNDTLAIADGKALQFDSAPGINSATITHDGTGLQFSGGGLLETKFDGDVTAEGNVTSAPPLGGSAVLNGGDSEVQIAGITGQNPKVRFSVPAMADGVIEYTGMAFTFNPPLTDSDFQTLSIIGNDLTISGGNTVTLPTPPPPAPQTLDLSGNELSISDGNTVTLPAPPAPQTLDLSGNELSISDGNTVTLPAPPAPQTLDLSGNELSISDGNTVTLPAPPAPQTLDLSGNELSISDGNTVTLPAGAMPGGASQDIQYNNGAGGFAGDAGLTYDPVSRVMRLTEVSPDSRIVVLDSGTNEQTEVRSGTVNLIASGQQVIQMVASAFPSIAVKFADNSIRTDVFGDMVRIEQSGAGSSILAQGSVVLSDFATGSQTRLAVAPIPVCRVANTTTSTEQNASSFDMFGSNVLKASLAYNAGSGGVGLTSVNNGEIFFSRSDGSTPESIMALQANNTYSLGNPATASNCVLDFNKGATEGQITFDGSGFSFNPPLPAPAPQTLDLSGNDLSISGGNTVTLPAPPAPQTLDLSGNDLSISGGNTVTLPTAPPIGGSNTQVLYKSGSDVSGSADFTYVAGALNAPALVNFKNGLGDIAVSVNADSAEIQVEDVAVVGTKTTITPASVVVENATPEDTIINPALIVMNDASSNQTSIAPALVSLGAGSGTNIVLDAVATSASIAITVGVDSAQIFAGYATVTLPPTADDQLTRKDYVDSAVASASGTVPYAIYCVATASPGGDGSWATPFNSIADAITAAVAGSVIYLTGTFTAVQTTIAKSNFTLKALGQAVIQYSSGAIPTTPYRGFWGMLSGTSNVTFDGITFSSTIQPAAELNLLTVAGSNHVVRNCVFAGVSSYDAFNPGAITTRGIQCAAGVANVLVEDCDIYNLRQPIYTNTGSGSFLRNSITNTRGAVNSSTGNFYQYTANRFGQNVLDIVILTGVQTGAPYADLYQLSADNNYAVVQDQRVTPNITLQASLPLNVSYNTAFPLGTIAQPYYTYFLNSGLGGSIAMPSTTNANGQWISFNNVPQLPNAGTLTITSATANIYDGGTLNTAVVLTAGQQKKFVFSSAANAWLPVV